MSHTLSWGQRESEAKNKTKQHYLVEQIRTQVNLTLDTVLLYGLKMSDY